MRVMPPEECNMKVSINNKQHQTQAITLYELASELQLPQKGVAIAIDNQLKPRSSWADVRLEEGVCITIIKAACGG
jgi:sulfur carrier protein